MEKKHQTINKNLKLKIVEKFGTQEKLAHASNIDEAIISKIVRNVRTPTDAQKEKISKLLKTPQEELFK